MAAPKRTPNQIAMRRIQVLSPASIDSLIDLAPYCTHSLPDSLHAVTARLFAQPWAIGFTLSVFSVIEGKHAL